MKATVNAFYGDTDVTLTTGKYQNNGNLAIQMWDEDGPFASLTINLSGKCKPNRAFVDTSNCPWAEDFINKYKLGTPTGNIEMSGWCVYPEYEFDMAEIEKYIEEV